MSILRLAGVTREIGTFTILDSIDAAIALGHRIGLVGPNGAGKTTLLRLAAGTDEPDRGAVSRKRNLTIGLLAQEAHLDATFMASLDLRAAVRSGAAHLEAMATELADLERAGRVTEPAYADLQHRYEVLGGYTLDQRVDAALSGLGFTREEWAKPPTALSGGEQTRAALARLVIADPDLLLLDEPTNHLDLETREALTVALAQFEGTLVLVSHDRHLLRATTEQLLVVAEGAVKPFDGDLDDYRDSLLNREAKPAAPPKPKTAKEKQVSRKPVSRKPIEARIKRLEELLARLGAQKTDIEARLGDPALYAEERKDDLRKLLLDQAYVGKELAQLEAEWLEKQAQLEAAARP